MLASFCSIDTLTALRGGVASQRVQVGGLLLLPVEGRAAATFPQCWLMFTLDCCSGLSPQMSLAGAVTVCQPSWYVQRLPGLSEAGVLQRGVCVGFVGHPNYSSRSQMLLRQDSFLATVLAAGRHAIGAQNKACPSSLSSTCHTSGLLPRTALR